MPTDEEITSIETQITEDLEAGSASISVDGMSVSQVDPVRRLEALERLENRQAVNGGGNLLGRLLRHSSRIVSHGSEEQ